MANPFQKLLKKARKWETTDEKDKGDLVEGYEDAFKHMFRYFRDSV